MKIKKQVEFNNVINDILKNDEVISLRHEYHHGISRLDHSLSVAKLTYNICKLFKIKTIKETTRAALLQDFKRVERIPVSMLFPSVLLITFFSAVLKT